MDTKYFKPGDMVRLTGKDWGGRIGLERTIVCIGTDGTASLTPHDRYTYLAFKNDSEDYSAVLIERDGKKVRAIAKSNQDCFVVTYEDGTSEYYHPTNGCWHVQWETVEEHLKEKNWSQVYPEPEPIDLLARVAQIKANHGYCDEFDKHVARAEKIIADGDLKSVLELIAYEQGYSNLIEELNAPEPEKKIKWPKGSTTRGKKTGNLYTVTEDCYEGDKEFLLTGHGATWGRVENHERVEVTVVDEA